MTEMSCGREAPEDVFFGADQSHVEAIGIEVEDSSQCALLDQLAEFHHCRMIEEDVPDHQHPRAFLGQRHQRLSLLGVQGQGFLYEHVLAGFQALPDQVVVRGCRRGDGHGGELWIAEHLFEVIGEWGAGVGKFKGLIVFFVGVADAAKAPNSENTRTRFFPQ